MGDTQLRDVLDAGDQLLEEPASFFFVQFRLRCDVFKQLAVGGMFHHQVEPRLRLDDLVELNDVRMAHLLQNVDLALHSLDV